MKYHGGWNYYSQKTCLPEGWAAENIKIESINDKKDSRLISVEKL